MTKIQKPDNFNFWQGLAAVELSHSMLVGKKNGTDILEDSKQFLTKLTIALLHDLTVLFLGIYSTD